YIYFSSLSLHDALPISAVLLKRELLLAIVGGIFVAEALSVIAQVGSYKFRNKKRVLLCAPLHHHFEFMGWAETKVVLRFWIIGRSEEHTSELQSSYDLV